jgi:hypothetical protein
MQEPSPAAGDRRLERAIILTLLSGDGEPRWSCAGLAAELGIESQVLQGALDRLTDAGWCASPVPRCGHPALRGASTSSA